MALGEPHSLAGMITVEKIRIYQRFCGDVDGFSRGGTESEIRAITDEEWHQIGQIVQRLSLIKTMPVTDGYKSETSQLISTWVSDESALAELNRLAE